MKKDIPLYTSFNGRRVVAGNLRPDGTFFKTVQRKQKLFAMDSYGLDETYIKDAISLGCKQIMLKERDSGAVFKIGIEQFQKYAVKRSLGKFRDRLYCPMRYWERVNTQKPAKQVQLALS